MANIQPRYNKDGKIISYSIRVFKGRDTNGKQLKPYSMTFEIPEKWSEEKAKKEAEKAAILFEKECKEGIVADNKQTFAKYAKYVIDLKENVEKKKHRTIKRYNELLERINPAIGHIKLTDLKPQHLNKFYEQLSQKGMNTKTGGYLSPKTIIEHHRLIHTILAQADKEMLVTYNAAAKATPPNTPKKEVNFYQINDVKRIRRYLKFEPMKWRIALLLLIYTGGRRGEVCGVKIKDINIKEKTIHFCNNILYSSQRGIYEDTLKTSASDRILKVSDTLIQLIKKYIQILKEKQITIGTKWVDTGYLLTQENGLPIHPDSVTDYCNKFSKKYNKIIEEKNKTRKIKIKPLPHINPHAFRHTHVSILLLNGVDPLSASKRAGHSNTSTTTNVYGHLLKKADEKAADIFDNVIR